MSKADTTPPRPKPQPLFDMAPHADVTKATVADDQIDAQVQSMILKFLADYPGQQKRKEVIKALGPWTSKARIKKALKALALRGAIAVYDVLDRDGITEAYEVAE
jgi:hypothetical protein